MAAVGFAFGHPEHSMASKATTSKSRIITRDMLEIQYPSTPSPSPQSAPASTSKLQKRRSYGWPPTSSSKTASDRNPARSSPEDVANVKKRHDNIQGLPPHEVNQPVERKVFSSEIKTPEHVHPSRLRPSSTISSIRSGSPSLTSPLESASMSQSNGSTAPILPTLESFAMETPPRNKLVKRSSSQRMLNGDSKLQSTLRRPATSHQRSATLRRQNIHSGDFMFRSFHSSPLPYDLPEHRSSFDDAAQRWRPFFKPQFFRAGKERSTRKHGLHGNLAKNETLLPIVPDVRELPTLLLATSISAQSSDESTADRPSNFSQLRRPFTAGGLSSLEISTPQTQPFESSPDFDDRPTTSFSLSQIFPSPSPMTWKMPRAGSVRGKKFLGQPIRSRRVASAPQPSKFRTFATPEQDGKSLGNHINIYAEPDRNGLPPNSRFLQNNASQRSPISPLPPLNRLSSFRIDLPESIPSYPTSPQLSNFHGGPQDFFKPSLPPASPPNRFPHMGRAYLPSGTHSEYASTLLESDNDNSRVFSGDDDDLETRSSTIYDSTKTGPTSGSLSGTKRPHIETIFDESPPVLPGEDKLLALENLHINDSKFRMEKRKAQSTASQLHYSDAVERTNSCPDQDITKLDQESSLLSDSTAQTQSSIVEPSGYRPSQDNGHKILVEKAMRLPSKNGNSIDEGEKYPTEAANTLHEILLGGRSTSRRSTPRRRESPDADSAKMNLFEWSEQTPIDRDNTQTDLGRPRTVHGRQSRDPRGVRLSGRRGPPPLHLRSQSVPVPNDNRSHGNGSKAHGWVLGKKSASEDWDGDFDFEEPARTPKQAGEGMHSSILPGMLVPRAILERQASVHGQFGQVKELTKLVEELKRLQQQAKTRGILNGQAIELWREAEGTFFQQALPFRTLTFLMRNHLRIEGEGQKLLYQELMSLFLSMTSCPTYPPGIHTRLRVRKRRHHLIQDLGSSRLQRQELYLKVSINSEHTMILVLLTHKSRRKSFLLIPLHSKTL